MRSRTGAGGAPPVLESGPGERAVAPAVGKTLELGIVVLFVGLLTTVLLGGVVPGYRAAAGAEVGDRVLATVAQEVESAVPPAARDVSARRTVAVPTAIAGSGYSLRVDGRRLVLEHPNAAVSGQLRLSLPPRVDRIEGRADGGRVVVTVRGDRGGLVVEIGNGGAP
ncbi:MAG: hypothetical protein ABEJ26_10445 [Halosimplex sp.]